MKRLWPLIWAPLLFLFVGVGCTTEDKRQWNQAMREWRGDNIRFGSQNRMSP